MPTPITILVPRAVHPAVEERYAFAQSRLLMTRSADAMVREYDPAAGAAAVVEGIESGVVVVLTDPLLLSPDGAAAALAAALEASGADAVVPVTNESTVELQRAPAAPYLTLRQFQEASAQVAPSGGAVELVWPDADPGLFATRASALRERTQRMAHALTAMRVAVAQGVYAHRYASQRGQARTDLLDLVSTDARQVLEFGCGEGAFAAALKARQPCRVVGVELDPDSAAIARSRVDELIAGDVRTLVGSIGETFDWIIGGDIVEHLDDPWQFLRDLRGVCVPGGRLLLSLPNFACWPIVRDLLAGRFDYVYMGIACAGHLRFFTRATIEDMLRISGWRPVAITPQAEFRIPAFDEFLAELRSARIPFSENDLATPGYYVVATPA
jgi:2-polyprenyl-3-methyl-5-hydroxy-6-metoxy-1,4-benzoquinol methylase